jgi:alpha-tubulin suppressor-like RCC1 family protein
VVDGAVLCWGDDAAGQLGDGASQNRALPVQVIAAGAAAVAAGSAHTCAVTGPAGAKVLSCWGDNGSGQVADGVNSPALQPTPLVLDLGALHPTGAAAGNAHTCAFSPDTPGPLCFGGNASSELGLPPTPRGSNTLALASVQALTAGYHHTCALLSDGGVRCWGANDRGQLGNGAQGEPLAEPVDVSGR